MKALASFLLLFSAVYTLHTQSQTILLLDDFEKFPNNAFNLETAAFQANADIKVETLRGDSAFCRSGKSLRVAYDVSSDTSSFCGIANFLPPTAADLSAFNYLSFWMRGKAGQEYMVVEMETLDGDTARVAVANYLPCGPGTDWQKVVIPLDAFWNLTSRTTVYKVSIVFSNYTAVANGLPLAGEVHLDEFLFGTCFPGVVRIDPFEDKINSNATGGNNGDFAETGSSGVYLSQTECMDPGYGNCNCVFRLKYNNGLNDKFGGAFFILGGLSTGWEPAGKNIERYDSLYLEAWAPSNALNPGNFKVELKGDTTHAYRILDIGLNKRSFSIPFAAFSPPVNPFGIGSFTIVFEKNKQDQSAGEVFVDNIELRAEGHLFPDSIRPAAPYALAVNGNPAQPVQLAPPGAPLTIAASIENAETCLETVRLEYYIGCAWVCAKKRYGPFNTPLVEFALQTGDIPENTWMDIRVVAENYTGMASASSTFQIKVGADTPPITTEELMYQAFDVFQFLRYGNGVYTDAARFDTSQFHPASVATTGMGLISLCIADAMGWISNAEALALETLASMNGFRPGFAPERNICGWFRHFIDQVTGKRAWSSEFSSIDSGILAAGAQFCKNYFSDNDSIAQLADCLYLSIDWESMIADPVTGSIYLTADSLCQGGFVTLPFNEYILVAWLAKNDYRQTGKANQLWEQHFADPAGLPTASYQGIDVLTDSPGQFRSSFIHQFAYYLCHYYATQPAYLQYFKNAMQADSAWWARESACNDHIWGFGAGASVAPSGYNADDIDNHPGAICSPHIIGGFIPVYPDGLNDLLWLSNAPLGVYHLPDNQTTPVLWRFSTEDSGWKAGDVQGVDYSSLLMGIAAHPSMLGQTFFEEMNNFAFPQSTCMPVGVGKGPSLFAAAGQNYPNPFSKTTIIPVPAVASGEMVHLVIHAAQGRPVFEQDIFPGYNSESSVSWHGMDMAGKPVPGGVYFYSFQNGYSLSAMYKMIVVR